MTNTGNQIIIEKAIEKLFVAYTNGYTNEIESILDEYFDYVEEKNEYILLKTGTPINVTEYPILCNIIELSHNMYESSEMDELLEQLCNE